MGKHLTIEEKLNAENELKFNRQLIKVFREQINKLKYRNERLNNFLKHKKYSEHCGMYGIDGLCYKLYGKKRSELNTREAREYDAITKLLRKRKKLEDK